MSLRCVPNLRDPEKAGMRRVIGNDIAQATRHRLHVGQNGCQPGTSSRHRRNLSDQPVHSPSAWDSRGEITPEPGRRRAAGLSSPSESGKEPHGSIIWKDLPHTPRRPPRRGRVHLHRDVRFRIGLSPERAEPPERPTSRSTVGSLSWSRRGWCRKKMRSGCFPPLQRRHPISSGSPSTCKWMCVVRNRAISSHYDPGNESDTTAPVGIPHRSVSTSTSLDRSGRCQ